MLIHHMENLHHVYKYKPVDFSAPQLCLLNKVASVPAGLKSPLVK